MTDETSPPDDAQPTASAQDDAEPTSPAQEAAAPPPAEAQPAAPPQDGTKAPPAGVPVPAATPLTRRPWFRTVLTVVLTLAVCGTLMGVFFRKQLREPLSGGDNAEWRDEARERNTFGKIVDYRYYSGRAVPSAYYNPVQILIWRYLITHYDYERSPRAYHLFCHGIQLLNAVLLALIALALLDSVIAALCIAASFIVFFPNFETAGWVSGTITTGTASLFFLGTVFAFLRYLRTATMVDLGMSCASYFLGLLTKESVAFAVPVMAAYYAIAHRRRVWRFVRSDGVFLLYAALTMPTVLVVFSRMGHSAIVTTWGGFDFGYHMAFRFFDLFAFLVTAHQVSQTTNLVITACALVLFPVAFWLARRDKVALFLLLWLVVSIAAYVYSNFRDVYSLQRYLYMPSVPWFLLLFRLAQLAAKKYALALYVPLLGYTVAYNMHFILKAQG